MMDPYGIHWGFFFVQTLSLVFLIAWPVLSILALVSLRHRRLEATAEPLWALVIILVPILGAAAFWIVSPQNREAGERE